MINKIKQLVETEDFGGLVAIQDAKNEQISLLLRGNEQSLGGCIISLLGTDRFSREGLAYIAAFCLAKANGFREFRNAQKFADYLMNSAAMYAQMSGDKMFS